MFTWVSVWLVYSVHFLFMFLCMYLYVRKKNNNKKILCIEMDRINELLLQQTGKLIFILEISTCRR